MVEFKGTPGPWNVDPMHPADIQAGGQELATMIHEGNIGAEYTIGGKSSISASERDANARLIAAAPDILDALAGIIGIYVDLAESGDAGFWDAEKMPEVIAARSAIAKAIGE